MGNYSFLVWDGILMLRAGIYEGAKFKLSVMFTKEFPKELPIIKFVSKVFHPFVNI